MMRGRYLWGLRRAGVGVCIAGAIIGGTFNRADGGVSQTEYTIQPNGTGPVRHYIVAEPTGYDAGAPVVVVLHGGGQSMESILEETAAPARWLDLAEDFGFLLVVPNGFNVETMSGEGDQQTWNDLRGSSPGVSEQNDVAFIEAALDREAMRYGFDPEAVFVTGSSNGGMMAQRLLIERAERFAAGAAFIANLPQEAIPAPSAATPVMIMNGDADPLMPWEGGVVGAAGAPVRSAPATVAYWTESNGTEDQASETLLLPDLAPSDGTRILKASYFAPGSETAEVILYRVLNGGHSIPVLSADPQVPLPPGVLGLRCHDVRGVDEAWNFFRSHLPRGSCAADLDGDGVIGSSDLAQVLASWDLADGPSPADINGDGVVGSIDLAALLGAWGPCD